MQVGLEKVSRHLNYPGIRVLVDKDINPAEIIVEPWAFSNPKYHFAAQKAILDYQVRLFEEITHQKVTYGEGYVDLPQFRVELYPDNLNGGVTGSFGEIQNLHLNIKLMKSEIKKSYLKLNIARIRGLYDSKDNFDSLQSLSDWYSENMPDYITGFDNEGYPDVNFYIEVDESEHLPLTIFIKKEFFLGE